jgi:hypothetical protein
MTPRTALLTFLGLLACSFTGRGQSPTTVGGYGELHYNEPDGSKKGQLDFHRFVVYLNHSFNEKLVFRSEIELEHTLIEAGEPEGGELSLEQAFLEYRLNTAIGFRGGILLVPVGLINLYHEPPTFHGVERPAVDHAIIPTTWREAGAGVFGQITDALSYQAYVVAGLDASGFSASSGLRGGRQRAFESSTSNPSLTGRLDLVALEGLQVGGSFFVGASAGSNDTIGTATVTLWSADVRARVDRFAFRAVGALGTIGDAERINTAYGKSVAEKITGFYLEGAYDVLPLFAPDTEQEVFLFARYEKYNTQARTTGPPLEQYNRENIVFGLTYLPVYNVALKFDYTFFRNALNSGSSPNSSQLNLGVGYYFN